MAIRKTSGKKKPTVRKPAKPSVRKPAKPSLRRPAKAAARKPAARKTVARKPVRPAVRKTAPARKPAASISRTPASPVTPAPRPTPTASTGGFQNDNAGSSSTQQPSFYRQPEQPLAMHTVKEGETLSAIALRYYGNASERHHMHIYNANRAILTDGPNVIRSGQELTIPKPPAD